MNEAMTYTGYSLMTKGAFDAMWEEETEGGDGDSFDADDEPQDPYPAIYCYECGKQLRTVDGVELEEIHTASNGEDVCEECCDVCANEDEEDEDEEDEDA